MYFLYVGSQVFLKVANDPSDEKEEEPEANGVPGKETSCLWMVLFFFKYRNILDEKQHEYFFIFIFSIVTFVMSLMMACQPVRKVVVYNWHLKCVSILTIFIASMSYSVH